MEETKNKEETKTQIPVRIGNTHMMFDTKHPEQAIATINNI